MKTKAILVGAVLGAVVGHVLEEPVKRLLSGLKGGGSGLPPEPKSVAAPGAPK